MRGWPPHLLGQPRGQEAIRRSEGSLELASGQGLPTGKELYSKVVDEAEDMIMTLNN